VAGGGNTTQLILDWLTGSGPVNVTATNACGSSTRTSTQANSCREAEQPIAMENVSLQVFPNPTSGIINITFSSMANSNAQVAVTDLQGRKVATQALTVVEGLNNAQLDLSKLAKGLYVVEVKQNNTTNLVKVSVE